MSNAEVWWMIGYLVASVIVIGLLAWLGQRSYDGSHGDNDWWIR